jgi:hypothetical protein
MSDWTWHVDQASRIHNLTHVSVSQDSEIQQIETAISEMQSSLYSKQAIRAETSRALCVFKWEVGEKLNSIYGFFNPKAKDRADQCMTPYDDKSRLTEIYGYNDREFSDWRRFHSLARTVEARDAVITGCSNWKNIVTWMSAGAPKDKDDTNKPDYKPKDKTPYSGMSNVPSNVYVSVIEHTGLDENSVKNYIRSYLESHLDANILIAYIKAEQKLGH